MKLQKLTIHNIASIGNATIDFDAWPLASSEVFLICGKTGSGKSTILDAICLALFAKTPRLESTLMQGDIQDGDKAVKLSDPRQLMRRNTGEAYSTLTFTGSNGIRYEATWSVARARSRAAGNLQSKKWSLTNLDTGHTLAKDDEIRNEMQEAIGLDFSQFCRTTLLAQGEFTRFLNSKDEEKAAILEKITGVDIYSRIGKKVFEIHAAKEAQWKDARKLIESIAVLSDEEITGRKETAEAISSEYAKVKASRDAEYSRLQWIIRANELKEKVIKAEEEHRIAERAVQEEGFVKKEQLVSLWNKTIGARQWLRDGNQAKQEKQALEASLSRYGERYIDLLSGRNRNIAEISEIRTNLHEISNYIESEQAKSEIYANAQAVCGYLETVMHSRRMIANEEAAISNENQLLAKEQAERSIAVMAEEQAKAAFEAEKRLYEKADGQLASADLPSARREKESHLSMISAIEYALECTYNFEKETERSRKRKEYIADICASINAMNEKLSTVEPMTHDAQIRMEERRKYLEEQRTSADDWSKQIRSKLSIGDVCPVCRQIIGNELPHEDYLNGLLANAEKAFYEAEKAYRELYEHQNMLNSDIRAQKMLYQNEKAAFDEDKTLQATESKAIAACRKCGIETIGTDTVNILKSALENENVSKGKAEAKISEAEAIERKVKEHQRKTEILRKTWDESKDKRAGIEKSIDECIGRITVAQGIIKAKSEEISDAEIKAGNLIGTSQWKHDWRTETENFIQELAFSADKFIRYTRRQQSLMAEYNEKRIIMENIESDISALIRLIPEWGAMSSRNQKEVAGLHGELSKLLGDVRSAKDLISKTCNSISEARKKLSEFLKTDTSIRLDVLTMLDRYRQEDIKEMSDMLNDTRNAVLVRNTAMLEAHKLQEEHFAEKPPIEDDESIESLSESIAEKEKMLNDMLERKGAIYQELKSDAENKERLSVLISDAENKKTEYMKWSGMNSLIGDATGNKFRKIAQSYVLADLIHSANTYMKTLTDRYTLSVEPGTFVISIEDAYQGYVRRAASTISGGESFLVSLSLALALSDIGQHFSVDTLFIDEGFGTLSGEALQNAINTLRSLHTKAGRHVGIISHVEELRERIPVQIRIEQDGRNSCSTVKVTAG